MKDSTDRLLRNDSQYYIPVMLFQSLIIILSLVAAIIFPELELNPQHFIYPLCVFLLALYIWTLWSWYALTGSMFSPYILFMSAAFAFNAGLALLEVFHLDDRISQSFFPPLTVLRTLALVAISLIAFHTGALITASMRLRRGKADPATPVKEQDGRPLRLVGSVLIGVAAIPAVIVFKQSFSVVGSSGYFGLYQQPTVAGLAAWSKVIAEFLVPGSLFLLAGSRGKRCPLMISSAIILCYSALLFFLGGRAGAIMPLLAYLWLWHRTIRRVPKSAVVAIAVVLIVVLIPLIATFRNTTGSERYSLSKAMDAYRAVENPAIAAFSEMGGSMATVAYTLELVPKTRGFDMGASYFYSVLAVVPNLFWEIHPAAARGNAALWLVETVEPETAAVGGGLGYSFIAEAFLNFGWWGTPIVMCLMGFLFGRLVLWADLSGINARLAMVAAFISFFLFFARSESASLVRVLLWYSLLPYLAVCFLQEKRSEQREGSQVALKQL